MRHCAWFPETAGSMRSDSPQEQRMTWMFAAAPGAAGGETHLRLAGAGAAHVNSARLRPMRHRRPPGEEPTDYSTSPLLAVLRIEALEELRDRQLFRQRLFVSVVVDDVEGGVRGMAA